jgi:hypothetical protein
MTGNAGRKSRPSGRHSLSEFTSAETATVGGYPASRCTGSSSPVNSGASAPGTPHRYFVTKIK